MFITSCLIPYNVLDPGNNSSEHLWKTISPKVIFFLQLTTWVWHGDGFVSPNRIVIEKTATSLSPYVYNLPPEMFEFVVLLERSGSWSSCNSDVLLGMWLFYSSRKIPTTCIFL